MDWTTWVTLCSHLFRYPRLQNDWEISQFEYLSSGAFDISATGVDIVCRTCFNTVTYLSIPSYVLGFWAISEFVSEIVPVTYFV